MKPKEIANKLGYSRRTIEREIKKGLVEVWRTKYDEYAVELPDSMREKESVLEYSADVAEQKYIEANGAKGRKMKIGSNYALVEFLEKYIGEEKYSPYAALQEAKIQGKPFADAICLKTLYNYIDIDLFLNISNKDLWVKKNEDKPKRIKSKVRTAYTNQNGRSIDERPKEILERNEYGHWEMDTVVGKNKSALLVFTERKTREEIIIKIKRKSQTSVIKAIDKLERRLGAKTFREKFKTITSDNGCEFLCQEGIERSAINKKKNRTVMYYCHPYRASERGSNENANKLIRRFIPKGADISTMSEDEIKHIENYINNYPRKILGGAPPRIAAAMAQASN